MSNPFFIALEADDFSANTLAESTRNVLWPFMHYLNNSIKALEDKEASCLWKPVASQRYKLSFNQHIYRITPVSTIKLLNGKEGWFEILCEDDGTLIDESFSPDINDPIIIGKGAARQRFTLNNDDYLIKEKRHQIHLPNLNNQDIIQWSGYNLKIRPLSVPLSEQVDLYIDGQHCKIKERNNNQVTLYGQVQSHSQLTINGQNMPFQLIDTLSIKQLEKYSPKEDGNGWLLFSSNKPQLFPHKLEDITHKKIGELSCGHLALNEKPLNNEDWSLSANKEGLVLEAINNKKLPKTPSIQCSLYPAMQLSVETKPVNEKWIQLIEKESSGDTGKSELDYFFDDFVKILDHTQKKSDDGYRVINTRPEERQVLLAVEGNNKKRWESVYPSIQGKPHEIRVSVDTSQLKRQKDAINQLMNRPSAGHWPLIKILQDRQETHWDDIKPADENAIDWQVLTDPSFDGCDRQRNFVAKALKTPDFAILDGPPGTGKTTTILELIIQLVLQGKRVLLSASTHAAINNVLERVKEDPALNRHIFPLRVGKESHAIGIEAFQFDNLYEQLKQSSDCEDFSHQLMVDSSNLVCGTTIGILRLFKDENISLEKGEPPFDVMIIDECSKTTFQEFLVPARFAKRWILVGDVRQLSPFTDREQIVANLDNLMLTPPRKGKAAKTLPPAIQKACHLLEELRGNHKTPYQHPMIVPVSSGVLTALNDEISARKQQKELSNSLNNILLIQRFQQHQSSNTQHLIDINTACSKVWHLYRSHLCFVDEECLHQLQPVIPDDALVLHSAWQFTDQAFRHKQKNANQVKSFRVKTTEHTDTTIIQSELLDRFDKSKWSEEVCWRLEREYWLRLSANYEKKTGYLNDTLDRLFPKSVNANGRIHMLKNIAFPSILEALSGDGLAKRKNDNPTTLNKGFYDDEKEQRHTTLTYQHRMHPDISEFPRKQFYKGDSLQNGGKTETDRAWQYKRYPSRNTWLDVNGSTFKNANHDEADVIIRELKTFCEWAEGKSKNSTGEPYDVAVLTFYKGQEKALREAMQKNLAGNNNRYARFSYKGVSIKLATVDYFQGQEADIVFLSMVNTKRDGFMDSPNRLNVSITRARYQLVIVGYNNYFNKQSRTEELKQLAKSCHVETVNKKSRRNK